MLSPDQFLFLVLNAGPDIAPKVVLLARGASQGEAICMLLLAMDVASARNNGTASC